MEQQLKELFESDEFLAQDISKFRKLAKERIPDVTNKLIKDFYSKNIIKQIMTPFRKKRTYNPIITLKHNHVIYFDSAFLKLEQLGIVLAMDLFSKKAYALVVKLKKKKTKKDGKVIPGTSVKAEDALRLLRKILETDPYKEIRTDGGSEHKDVFQQFIQDTPGLTQKFMIDQSKRLNSPIERFIRTFRGLFAKKKEIKKGRVYRDKQRFVDEVINTYNNSVHRTISFTPNQVFFNENNARSLVKQKYRDKLNRALPPDAELLPGTKVRIYNRKKIGGKDSVFEKTESNWSKRVYTIQQGSYDAELKRYTINGKKYSRDYLLVVPDDSISGIDPQPRPRGRPRGPRRGNRRRNEVNRMNL